MGVTCIACPNPVHPGWDCCDKCAEDDYLHSWNWETVVATTVSTEEPTVSTEETTPGAEETTPLTTEETTPLTTVSPTPKYEPKQMELIK